MRNLGLRRFVMAVAGVAAGAVLAPTVAHAVPSTCNGALQLVYTAGANFPQPVPPGNTGDDILTVQLVLGAGAIQNGTKLTVNDVRFDLDCSAGAGAPSPCTDDGAVIQYLGDGTITTDCGVSWTSDNSGSTTPNEVHLTPSA